MHISLIKFATKTNTRYAEMMIVKHFIFILFFGLFSITASAGCGENGVWLQVLGLVGPEVGDKRASSSYVIWHDGKAKILVDIGSGIMLDFEKSGADANDLDVVLLTHLHVDHSGDMNNDNHTLTHLAKNADVLVAHHAIPEDAVGVARNLHMPPSVIGQIASQAKIKKPCYRTACKEL